MTMATAAPSAAMMTDHRFRAMNTDVQLIMVGLDPELARLGEAAVKRCEQRWSRFLDDSELSRLNNASGRPVIVAPDTYRLIEQAVDAFHLTDGVFDPTVLRCMLDAGYDRSFEHLDEQASVGTDIRPAPTPQGIEFVPELHAVRLPPGVGLDLGGIAKGATADLVAAELMMAGAAGCCVNVGGDIAMVGRGPNVGAWRVELDCPGATEIRAIQLASGAVCTSTVLRRRWGSAAHRQHHLRLPDSGQPMGAGLVTAAVIGKGATQAEVLTKVFLAHPIERAAEIAQRYEVTGVVVAEDGTITELPGLDAFLAPEPSVLMADG